MNLFTDQDVYGATVKFLISQDHDVICARDVGLSRTIDEKLMQRHFSI